MSNLLNKVKDALPGNKGHNEHKGDTHHSTNAGPHSSNIANTADPRIDSDRDHRNDPTSRVGGYGDQTTSGGYGQTAGGYGSTTHSGTHTGAHGATTTGGYGSSTTNDPSYSDPRSGNAGPHSSNLANKLDPRVDSDRDNRNDPTSRVGGYGDQGTSGGYTQGTSGGYGQTTGGYGGSNTAGPHSSNMANRADPRIDSDLDGSRTAPGGGYGAGAGTGAGYGSTTTGTHGTTGGYGQSTGGYGSSTAGGPHSSNLANKADPRVDSDFDGSRTAPGGGYGSTTSGTHGTHGTHGTQGGYGGQQGGYGGDQSVGTGRSDNAGPHNSNMMNKLDPRVDSDLSGGKTYGGNATHQ